MGNTPKEESYEIVGGRIAYSVEAMLGNMRKAKDWVIYPRKKDEGDTVVLQCDARICRFDLRTRKGVISTKGQYQQHLMRLYGAVDFEAPQGLCDAILAHDASKGETARTDLAGVGLAVYA